MNNSCSNSVSGSAGDVVDVMKLIAEGGTGFSKRLREFQRARQDAQAAAAHAQNEIERIRVYVADIKSAAEKEIARRLAELEAKEIAFKRRMQQFDFS